MLTYNEILEIAYLQLTGAGLLGNCILLFLKSANILHAPRTRSKNLIVLNLAISNAMLLASKGITATTSLWKTKCYLKEYEFGILSYIQTLARDISLCSTSILSVFQVITISPNKSFWALLKMRAPKCIHLCILFCWIFYVLIDIAVLLFQIDPKNSTDSLFGCNTGYRSLNIHNCNHVKIIITACVHDIVFLCIMTCCSVYMVLILYEHKKQVSHIHSNNLSIKTSPETRATQVILLLVGTFVSFNVSSPLFILYMLYFKYINTWLIHTSAFLSAWYPTISPYILITIENQISRICSH